VCLSLAFLPLTCCRLGAAPAPAPAPARSRRRQPSPSPYEPARASELGSSDSELDLSALVLDDLYPALRPPVPTLGNDIAPLHTINGWAAEFDAADCERAAAIISLKSAIRRRRNAYRNLCRVLGLSVSRDPPIDPKAYVRHATRKGKGKGKGKGKQRADPIAVDDGDSSDDEFDVSRELGESDGGSKMDTA
jgi:hypothetical protein